MQQNSQNKSRVDWVSLIAEQEKSGLSQKEFCIQRGLVLSKFVYHRCSQNKIKVAQPVKSALKPVQVVGKEYSASSSDIRVSLPNGFQCSFPCSLDTIQVKRIIEVLLSC